MNTMQVMAPSFLGLGIGTPDDIARVPARRFGLSVAHAVEVMDAIADTPIMSKLDVALHQFIRGDGGRA
jgi:hypothetical protein